jgi:hypothetical protein
MANGSYIKNGRLNHGAKINPCSVSTQNLIWPFRIRFPRFPHDGKKLAVAKSVSNISVSVMDADGTNVKLIFRADEGAVALAPEWSPKDDWIAFGTGSYFLPVPTENLIRRERL